MYQKQPRRRSSFRESLKALEADIEHANSLRPPAVDMSHLARAATLPQDFSGQCVQMRLSYSPFAPFIMFLIEWMDYSCTDTLPTYLGLLHVLVYKVYLDGLPTLSSKERKATLQDFYAVIYPSLRQLEGEFIESDCGNPRSKSTEALGGKRTDVMRKIAEKDPERDDECGICMESSTRMVLPNCSHSLCTSCFHDWYLRSQSCPFCRGSLKRVSSRDLWVLISDNDVLDTISLAKESLMRFYLYIDNLPAAMPEMQPFLLDYMI